MTIKYFVNPKDGEEFYNETVRELKPLKNQRVFNEILLKLNDMKNIFSPPV